MSRVDKETYERMKENIKRRGRLLRKRRWLRSMGYTDNNIDDGLDWINEQTI